MIETLTTATVPEINLRCTLSPKLSKPTARPPSTTVKCSHERNVRSLANDTLGSTLTGRAMRLAAVRCKSGCVDIVCNDEQRRSRGIEVEQRQVGAERDVNGQVIDGDQEHTPKKEGSRDERAQPHSLDTTCLYRIPAIFSSTHASRTTPNTCPWRTSSIHTP